MSDKVILVDENDNPLGVMDKLQAHQEGLLHRAFSVFVTNTKGEMLLQQRAMHKYHSGGLWTNTCCSHPQPDETLEEAAKRRLEEEMGFACDAEQAFSFIYKVELDNNLTEYELDHVLFGNYDANPNVNPDEVMSYKWVDVDWLLKDVSENPANYTEWFKLIIDRVAGILKEKAVA